MEENLLGKYIVYLSLTSIAGLFSLVQIKIATVVL